MCTYAHKNKSGKKGYKHLELVVSVAMPILQDEVWSNVCSLYNPVDVYMV